MTAQPPNPELPAAVLQNPACGACGLETGCHGTDFICSDCQLIFDGDTLHARYVNPHAPTCGAACVNTWHADNKIWAGYGHRCGTCQLPAGHDGSFHWMGCVTIDLAADTHDPDHVIGDERTSA